MSKYFYLNLVKGELTKFIIEKKRYFADTVISLVVFYFIFLGIFLGYKGIAGINVSTESLNTIVYSYIMWTFALMSLQIFANEINEEMQRGTLEQLYLNHFKLPAILITRACVSLVYAFLWIGVIVFFISVTTGITFPLHNSSVLLFILLSIPSLWGIVLMFSGFILIYKKISGALQVLNFALIGLIAIPAYQFNGFSLLSFAPGASLLKLVINENYQPSLNSLILIVGNSAVYLVLGAVVFAAFEKQARKKNLLSQY